MGFHVSNQTAPPHKGPITHSADMFLNTGMQLHMLVEQALKVVNFGTVRTLEPLRLVMMEGFVDSQGPVPLKGFSTVRTCKYTSKMKLHMLL